MAVALERNSKGQIVKRTAIEDEPITELAAEDTQAEATPGKILDQYRGQARDLEQALNAVRGIQQQSAEVAQQRANVLQQRETLLGKWEDESAVTELSKLTSRLEIHDAKLASLARKLEPAEDELKAALATFATSFNALFLTLRSFIVTEASSRISAMLHPSVRARSMASISEIAVLTSAVVDFEVLAIRFDGQASMLNNQLPPENIQRDAERALPKVAALLSEAAKYPEFVPPAAFSMERWRASLSPAVPVAA